jgi:hypothetical protein
MASPTFAERLAHLSEAERDDAIERAAILQYDAGVPRDVAEGRALMAANRAMRKRLGQTV